MQQDFLNELAELALGSRLKRMSERMLASASDIYQEFAININPKWFTLMALLDSKDQNQQILTIVEASSLLGLSQPALSQFCKELQKEKLIKIAKDQSDSRKRILTLTTLGRERLQEMKPVWDAVQQAATDLCTEHNNDFYRSLLLLEKSFSSESLLTRTRRYIQQTALQTQVIIKPFKPALAHHFETINKEWIDDMFVLETIDKQVLEDPQSYIINKGGKIWFAEHPTLGIVGTCAFWNKGDNNFELTKMGVLKSARGLKVGEILLQHVLSEAKTLDIKKLFLLTNAKCEAAIHLYEKNGFVHDKTIMQDYGKNYARCNVAMLYLGPDSTI
ncbi:bifunctional helix-turn-helix transcriptional regulator/GNAT family N-acetyltransferase [uncultured Paraglaciecola sp.]|uniref:bifunctional helix-turn-helix transcriptional regulator/GNAT family N-acetyltransferase n=1 Tax=uncultured Paraglaciecola sp. TaxID=1765024 RepID=UPI0030D9477B|tara:strand:+ start:3768 stop:4763 length:996 start_codon:yes stop_codon:yes gene_type:complete